MNAFDEGFNLFKQHPDLMLSEVWRKKPIKNGSSAEEKATRAERSAFVEGYLTARHQRDEYEWEKNNGKGNKIT
jgi:hypothetical protein